MSFLLNLMPFWVRWVILAAFLASIAAFSAFKMHQHDNIRYDALQAKDAAFRMQVAIEGAAAQQRAIAQAQTDKLRKQNADSENASTKVALATSLNSLRQSVNSGSGAVSTFPARTDRVTELDFDRAELDRAIQAYRSGVLGLVEKGAAGIADLDTSKTWAQSH